MSSESDNAMRLGPWAASIGAGIAVAIASNMFNGGSQVRDHLGKVSIELATTNTTLAEVCTQLKAKQEVDDRQDKELEVLRLILERNRIR